MNIVDKLSGNELISIEKVITSMNMGLILLAIVSPIIVVFTVVIAVRHFMKLRKYKKNKIKLENEQKNKKKQIEKDRLNERLSCMHKQEMSKAQKAESLSLDFNSKGEINTHERK